MLAVVLLILCFSCCRSFCPDWSSVSAIRISQRYLDTTSSYGVVPLFSSNGSGDASSDPTEIIARKIVVTGDVQGGYLRACILNEVRKESNWCIVRGKSACFDVTVNTMTHSVESIRILK